MARIFISPSRYIQGPGEMKKIASLLGCDTLRSVTFEDIMDNIEMLRGNAGDRSVLRAIHFVNETRRAADEADALRHNDTDSFIRLVKASGDSSFKYLPHSSTNCFMASLPGAPFVFLLSTQVSILIAS